MITGQQFKKEYKFVAKIADFGLSKTFYDNITYKRKDRQDVPWKWMAPEFLNTNCLTLASDVWSFGVVIWELFSFGKEPYPGLTAEELITKLKNGYTLPCPEEMDKVGPLEY